MISFTQLGCTEDTRAAFDAACAELPAPSGAFSLGRVSSLDRSLPAVTDADGQRRCELAAAIKKSDDSQVAVGDWVVLDTAAGHEHPVICRILPRRSALRRVKRVGREGQLRVQVLAANVDRVFVCQSLSGAGLDRELLVRQMAAVRACGADCVFVFTKADLVGRDAVAAALACVAVAMPDLRAIASPAVEQAGGAVEELRALCPPGSTALFLGESGVGKSTLVNALAGTDAQQTGAVRVRDDKGRHTTVARRMLAVPDGGVVIDAPGLRTLQVLDAEACLRAGFPDIADLAPACRFRDCTHADEPGCAVRGAVAEKRLAAYLRLASRLRRP